MNILDDMKIITISREFGSGGRELGKQLANVLGYDYYDKEIIATLYSDYQSGTITKEELYKYTGELGLQAFITAQKLYKVMYGFTPQKVPIYCLSAYKDTDKETLAA